MAVTQKYNIKYPFSSDNTDNVFMDVNGTVIDGLKSQVLHVIFTAKGQKLRDPDFGTNLISYLFSQNDMGSMSDVKTEISTQLKKLIPTVDLEDISVAQDPNTEHGMIVTVKYTAKIGNKKESVTTAVRI